jgi:tetratricopeptide (TPR) repeat protein
LSLTHLIGIGPIIAGLMSTNNMGPIYPVQARLGSILACAKLPGKDRVYRRMSAKFVTAAMIAGLSLAPFSDVVAQVKQVPPLLEEARQAALDLHQLPVGDERASVLLTHGLDVLELANHMVEQHLDELGAAQGPLSKQDRRLTRLQQARVAYVQGELYRLTAMKRSVDDPTRAAYLDSAVAIFTEMRTKFQSIADAELARVGLARCYRLQGMIDDANKILEPLLRHIPDLADASAANLWRVAVIEQLELALITDPQQAMAAATQWVAHSAFADQSSWQHSLSRIEALAAVQLALKSPTAPTVQLAVEKLRNSNLPEAMQLQYLVRLELASDIPVISPQQRNDWVLLLVDSLKPQQAADRIAKQVPDVSVLNVQALLAFGSVLWQAGELPQAVNCFDHAMRKVDDSDPLRHTAALWYAQCLYQQVIQTGNTSIRARARAALSRLVQTHPSKQTRLTALKQWVSLEQEDEGLNAAAELVSLHSELADDDAYLHYVLANHQWETLKQALESQQVEHDAAVTIANKLIDDAQACIDQPDVDKQVAGGLIQLQARIYASPILKQSKRALALLDDAQTLLGQSQLQLKALMLIQANEVQMLWELINDSQDTGALSAGAWVLIVDALTDLAVRHPDDILMADRAAQLAIKAWNAAPDMSGRVRLGQSLVKLRKWDTCLTLLGNEYLANADPQLNLIIGQSLLGLDRDINQASAVLELVAKDMPQSPAAHLWLGIAYARTERHAQACEHYRHVRSLEKPATLPWWQATLGLAQSLAARGQIQAARQILQVTLTLYPVIGDDALANDLVQLLGRLQQP